MPLSIAERKHRLPMGAQKEIAREAGVSTTVVSEVVSEEYNPKTPKGRATERRIRVRVARKLGMKVDDVFPPTPPSAAVAQPEQIAGVA